MADAVSGVRVYVPSGRVGIRAIVIAVLVGMPCALAMGWLYAWARTDTASFVSVALCDLLFLVGNVLVLGMVAGQMRSRAPRFNQVFGLLWIGLMLLPWWLHVVPGVLARFDTPAGTADAVLSLAGSGVEALILGALPVFVVSGMARDPFSETLGQQATPAFTGELVWRDGDHARLLRGIVSEGLDAVLTAPRADGQGGQGIASGWCTVKLEGRWVEADPEARWVDVELLTHARQDDGRIRTARQPVVSAMRVSDTDFARARGILVDDVIAPEPVAAPAEDSANPPVAPELEPALAALDAGHHAGVLAMASAHCTHPRTGVRADARRLCALASSRLERWADAYDHYFHLFELEASGFNALQLATTSAMAGELLRAQAWFERALEMNRDDLEIPEGRMRTAYLSALMRADEPTACRPHLDWLANAYRTMGTTDSHLLWSRGLPFFGEFLERSSHILGQTMGADELRSWYVAMRDDLDTDGRAALDAHVAELA